MLSAVTQKTVLLLLVLSCKRCTNAALERVQDDSADTAAQLVVT